MKIRFKTALSDYQKNYFQNFVTDLKNRIFFIIVLPTILGYLLVYENDTVELILYCLLFGAISVIFILTPYLIAYYKTLKRIKEDDSRLGEKTISLVDAGIRIKSEDENEITRIWESITSLQTNRDYISIVFTNNNAILIPNRAFENEFESSNFIGTIQSNVIKARNSIKTFKTDERPPYLLGLVGIIPVIGAIVGIVIVIMGIFKYKNLWFTSIGAVGILFSGLIYSGVFGDFQKETKDEDPAKVIPIVQDVLESAIKDIEYYKIKYGKYPDSLKEINIFNIYDPAQTYNDKTKTFIYRVEGEKYLLFSSGLDGIPNTQDDIYPEILSTSQTGLIKYQIKKTIERKTYP